MYVANPSASAQARTLNALRGAGLSDAFAMPDDPEYKVSVGIFSEENRAEDRAARVQRLRLDAVVKERSSEQTVTWIDIPGVARETLADGRLAQTGLQLERLRIEACPAARRPTKPRRRPEIPRSVFPRGMAGCLCVLTSSYIRPGTSARGRA